MIVNPYKSFGGRIKSFMEKRYPKLLEKKLLPMSIMIYDRLVTGKSRKKSEKLINDKKKLFTNIEIETINRCNGECSFCPINRYSDPRMYKKMSQELYEKIIFQLKELNYSGSLGLYSNNEPLLDKRLEEFLKIARENLPKAKLYIFTNGKLLTEERTEELMKYLDKMVIDNYNDDLELIPSVRKVYEYIQDKPYKDRIKIFLRKENEILLNRGGESDNRSKAQRSLKSSCVYLYEQMIVRPDGKVSLCCNDAFGKVTMGDLQKDTINDVWNGLKYRNYRDMMLNGRGFHTMCRGCDSIITDVYANSIF